MHQICWNWSLFTYSWCRDQRGTLFKYFSRIFSMTFKKIKDVRFFMFLWKEKAIHFNTSYSERALYDKSSYNYALCSNFKWFSDFFLSIISIENITRLKTVFNVGKYNFLFSKHHISITFKNLHLFKKWNFACSIILAIPCTWSNQPAIVSMTLVALIKKKATAEVEHTKDYPVSTYEHGKSHVTCFISLI